MKLIFNKKYKSIDSFPTTELPDFTVITGLNGSGKTHLLEALENGSIKIDEIDAKNDEIRLFNWFTLVPNNDGKFDLAENRKKYWNQLLPWINEAKQQHKNTLESLENQVNQNIGQHDIYKIYSMTQDNFIKQHGNSQQKVNSYKNVKQILENIDNFIVNRFSKNGQQEDKQFFLNFLKSKSDSPLVNLTEETFSELYLSISTPINAFQQSFGQLFVSYSEKWNANILNKDRQLRGENIDYMSDEEFYEKNGEPPWDFVNKILQQNNLEFRIDKPETYDGVYEPKLIHQQTKEKIKFDSLSSGEKILISFAFCLYYTADNRQTVNYPKVLLFDEIDAPLHPSMTFSVLNTIQKTLVKEQNIKVIMTTHSPSTVALSPEKSIYVMDKETRYLKETSKDKALSLLTSGVPTLSINPENRKQVFVESEYDSKYYEKIYNKLKHKLIPEISLHFLPIGVPGENCDKVKGIVNKLVKFGNKSIYGIIDWDKNNNSNKSHPNIKILGENQRYTIENYIFDPLWMGIFLLIEDYDKFFKRLELNKHFDTLTVAQLTECQAQEIINSVMNKLAITYAKFQYNHLYLFVIFKLLKNKYFKLLNYYLNVLIEKFQKLQKKVENSANVFNEEHIECEYVNQFKLLLPKWYLHIKGHGLIYLLIETFPELNKYKNISNNGEEELKKEVLNKVINLLPNLISVDFLELFQKIQNYNCDND